LSDTEIDDDSATDQLSPDLLTTMSLSTDVTTAGVNGVSCVTISQVPVPLHTHQVLSADESSLQPLSAPPDVSAADVSSVQDITDSQAPAPPVDSSDAR